jgi:hypothetical protein
MSGLGQRPSGVWKELAGCVAPEWGRRWSRAAYVVFSGGVREITRKDPANEFNKMIAAKTHGVRKKEEGVRRHEGRGK